MSVKPLYIGSGLLEAEFDRLTGGGAVLRGVREGNLCSLEGPKESPWIICDREAYYLRYLLDIEVAIAMHWRRLQRPIKPCKAVPEGLNEQQVAAVSAMLERPVTLLVGGPGTGKTYTTAKALSALSGVKVVVAAPTGKAAATLQAALGGLYPVHTLHALLKIREGRWQPLPDVLDADLVVVDEASMIDAAVMATLLGAVRTGARLWLLGDPDQLPAVGVGAVFADLVQGAPQAVAKLTKVQRTDRQELVGLAQAIRVGDLNAVLGCLERVQVADIVSMAVRSFGSYLQKEVSVDTLKRFSAFRLLSPVVKGKLGVEGLNRAVLMALRRSMPKGMAGVEPIIIGRNSPALNLTNGEIGLLVRPCDSQPYGLFSGGEVIPEHRLPPYDLAYCISVHKSQGSEYGTVAVVLPDGLESFGREVLYTAVTRAKERVLVAGSDVQLATLLNRRVHRLSRLKDRL